LTGTAGQSDLLSRSELKRRTSAGVFITASWGLVNLVVGFAGNLVIARMLLPRDFGLVAIGTTLMMFAIAVSEGGLGSGLIRRPEPPTSAELSTVLGLQFVLTGALGAGIAAAAFPFGEAGKIAAIMIAALPLTASQMPGRVVLARSMLYRRLAIVDVSALITYYAWAIAGVAAGFGVWALATASVARALTGSATMCRVSGLGFLRPRLRGARALWPLVRFGIRFQGVSMTMVVRDQTLNASTAAIAGVATLGVWSFVTRLMQVPLLFFESIWRVSFPAMSQILASKEDPAPTIERSVGVSAAGAGAMLATFAAAAPELVPFMFGGQWRSAGAVVPWACLALLVAGPISVSTVGYLYAAGEPGAVLQASLAYAAIWVGGGLALLPVVGLRGLGIGWLLGSLADAFLLARATVRLSAARFARPLVAPVAVAVASGAAGWLVTTSSHGFGAGCAGGGIALGLDLVGLMLVRRALLVETVRLASRAVLAAVAHEPPAVVTSS